MSDNVSEHIEATNAILAETLAQLETYAGWHPVLYGGTSHEDLFGAYLPGARMPAAVVIYSGSGYQNLPRRRLRLSVLVAVHNPRQATGASSARELADRVVALLDRHTLNQATWKVTGDDAVDVQTNLACFLVNIDVEDY